MIPFAELLLKHFDTHRAHRACCHKYETNRGSSRLKCRAVVGWPFKETPSIVALSPSRRSRLSGVLVKSSYCNRSDRSVRSSSSVTSVHAVTRRNQLKMNIDSAARAQNSSINDIVLRNGNLVYWLGTSAGQSGVTGTIALFPVVEPDRDSMSGQVIE